MEPAPPLETPAAPAEPDLPPRAVMRARQLGLAVPVRHCTPVGTIDATTVAEVDPAGLLQRRDASWTLDWWVGAEDRWHHPSVEAAVRQELVEECPVVRTALRVPGGDVVQTVYGVRADADGPDGTRWDDDAVVVEVTNETSVPVALAVVVRPVTLDGSGAVPEVRVDGAQVTVDGVVAAVLSRPVNRVAAGRGPGGAAARLLADDDVEPGPDGVVVAGGGRDHEVACVVPLPHTATVRVLVPMVDDDPASRRRRRSASVPSGEWRAPDAEAVVAGWQAHSRGLAALEAPEPSYAATVATGGRLLTLAAGAGLHEDDGEVTAAARATQLAELLVRMGAAEPLEPLLATLAEARTLGGAIRLHDRSDATVALVHVAGALLDRLPDSRDADELLALVDAALRRVERRDATRRDAATARSAAVAAARLVPTLRRSGEDRLAAAAAELVDGLWTDAVGPKAVPSDGSTTAAALGVRAELAAGAPTRATQALQELLRLGSQGVLGDRVDADGRSCGARGLDAPAVAARIAATLDTAVLETATGADLLCGWTTAWYGAPVETHRVRTAHGEVSFALRWHGTRPALLWEVIAHEGADPDQPPVLRAPALDPSWSATSWMGEALLGEVTPPESSVSLRAAGGAVTPATPAPRRAAQDPPAAPGEGESFG